MKEIKVTTTLKKIFLRYDWITICDDFKPIFVDVEDGKVQRQWDVINPVDYSKEQVKEKYDLKTKVVKWMDSYLDDGKTPSMLVVLDKGTK